MKLRTLLLLGLPLALLLCMTAREHVDAQSTAKPHFTDVAAQSRFTYVTNNGYPGSLKYFIQPMCGGVAVLDYDNDGKQDIFFTNGASLPGMKKTAGFNACLLHNRGAGVFEDRTAAAGLNTDTGYGIGVAAGDFDNDGYTDLFLANAGENRLYRNNHDGTFSDVTKASGITKPANTISVGAAWFDYDGDGFPDLIVSDYTIWTPATDYRCNDSVKREIYCSPTRYVSVPDRLYHNLGNGKFEDVTDQSGFGQVKGKGMGISIADVNGDGRPDVFIVNDTERNFLFINQGNGKFVEQGALYGISYNDDGIAVNGMGSDTNDFNNDGFIDFFYNDLPTQVYALFAGNGKSFRYVSPAAGLGRLSYLYGGWGAGFVDYDNDGWKDIYSANGDVDYLGDNARQSDTMFRNLDGKNFADVSGAMGEAFTRKGFHRGSAFADFNNDGSQDIVVTGLGEKPRILMNTGTPGAHWLMLDLQGNRSSRDAVGAVIKVTTPAGRTLYNHVSISVGFMSSSDRRVHFGLGAEKSASQVEISWPSGRKQVLKDVAADQILSVRESE